MAVVSAGTPKWAISSRTTGEVLTASTAAPGIEIVLLGLPPAMAEGEASQWLADIVAVAAETSAGDASTRAIPPLLHHTLTGMLFTHAELWSPGADPVPSSIAFVTSPDGPAFGWVGELNVAVTVNGRRSDPIWVRVRDDAGREAFATSYSPGDQIELAVDWGGQGGGPPLAFVQASYSRSAPVAPPRHAPVARVAAPAPPQPPRPVAPAGPLPADLPVDRPSLAGPIDPVRARDWRFPLESPQELAQRPPVFDPQAVSPEAKREEPTVQIPRLPTRPDGAAGEPAMADPFRPAPVPPPPPAGEHRPPSLIVDLRNLVVTPVPPTTPAVSEPSAGPPEWGPPAILDDPASAQVPALPAEPDAIEHAPQPVAEPAMVEPAEPLASSPSVTPLAADAPLPPLPPPVASLPELPRPEQHPVQRWLSKLLGFGRRETPATGPTPAPFESLFDTPAAAEPAAPEAPSAGPAAEESDFGGPVPIVPEAMWPLPEPGAIRPAEQVPVPPLAEASAHVAPPSPAGQPIASVAAQAPPAPPAPVAPAPGLAPVHADDILRRIPAAAPPPQAPPAPAPEEPFRVEPRLPLGLSEELIAQLPTLSPQVAGGDAPVDVTHEPVGADEGFSIAPLPEHLNHPLTPDAERELLAGPPPLMGAPAVAGGEAPLVIETHVGGRVEPERREIPAVVQSGSGAAPASGAFAMPDWARAAAAAEAEATPASPRSWPAGDAAAEAPRPDWRRYAPWAGGLLALFAVGWLIGGLGHGSPQPAAQTPRWMRAIGLGGARFDATIDSRPNGAWVRIDGRDIARRTPAKVDLPPGDHRIELSMPDLGSASFSITGKKGENLHPVFAMTGALEIRSDDPSLPLRASLDGKDMGYVPVDVDSLAPGLHEVAFVGPGMPSWAQTVQVRVHETARVVAEPMTSPSTGMLSVKAQYADEEGSADLNGAQVYIDGEPRGRTPLSAELTRGPHSVRISWNGESAPVQVIDLPGGNQRFAMFSLGLGSGAPELTLTSAPRVVDSAKGATVGVRITGLTPGDVREAWLHVRGPEGVWRRYPLEVAKAARGVTLSGPYPPNTFDSDGQGRWYVSAITAQGDELYSEMQSSRSAGGN